uniref:Adenine nucleotide translocase lysine methyltransferase n=1 Tax=Neogobius melanostomus TaxID=47308 RepID=A0A8C6U144_9GOBI
MDDDAAETFAELNTKSIGLSGVAQIAAGTGLAVYAMWVGILQPGFRRIPLKLQVKKNHHTPVVVIVFFTLDYNYPQVPYIPASQSQVRNVMTLLKGRKGNIVDLGSGDGRIVLEAHRRGFTPAVGYELNPWLIYLSRFNAWRADHHSKVSYKREDLWKVGYPVNLIYLFHLLQLSLLQKKLLAELPDDALVIAGRFPFPDWTPCRMEGLGVDRAWAYNKSVKTSMFCVVLVCDDVTTY